MNYMDRSTGEIVFEFVKAAANRVNLVLGFGQEQLRRLPMRFEKGRWTTRLSLPPGWVLYSFEVDGRLKGDAEAGRLRAKDGSRCSLALIPAMAGVSGR
jgi:hypothetical protein